MIKMNKIDEKLKGLDPVGEMLMRIMKELYDVEFIDVTPRDETNEKE